jgi:hypothetical protein
MHHRYPIQSNCQPTVFGRQEGFANLPHNDIMQTVRGFRPSLRGTQGVENSRGVSSPCMWLVFSRSTAASYLYFTSILERNVGQPFNHNCEVLPSEFYASQRSERTVTRPLLSLLLNPVAPPFIDRVAKKIQFYRYQFWSAVDYS